MTPSPASSLQRLQAAAEEMDRQRQVELLRADQWRRWHQRQPVPVEFYRDALPDLLADPELLFRLVCGEILLREERDEAPTFEEYHRRFPNLTPYLERFFGVKIEAILQYRNSLDRVYSEASFGSETVATANAPVEDGTNAPRRNVTSPCVTVDPESISSKVVPGYEVLGKLGQGGMGVVYKARDLKLGRTVALKMVLHGEHADEPELVRFLTEAEAVAQLQHVNVVPLFESGRHNGLPYFTLEFIDGGTLADRLRDHPLSPREAARVVEQIAHGVQHAHERGILHRDLKPGNVLLTREGTPRVTDFGLAKRLDVGTALTATGNVMGTPSYMAPEQARGDSKRVGPTADVYALGAILYECLTGRPPFRAATMAETLFQVIGDEPVPLRSLAPKCPRDLETVCQKCLQKIPERRYASAQELADDLRRVQNGEPIQARPVGPVERAVKWARRRPTVAALVAVGVLLLVGAVVGSVLYSRQLRETRDATRAQSLLKALRSADTAAVGYIVEELAEVRTRIEPQLRAILMDPEADPREQLHAAMALLPGNAGQIDYLTERLLTARPTEISPIREALRPHGEKVAGQLWSLLLDGKADGGRRLRAACALADYDPDDPRWKQAAPAVVQRLVAEDALLVGPLTEALRPVRAALLGPLGDVFRDAKRPEVERRLATSLLADYAADRPEVLTALLEEADEWQYGVLFPVVQNHRAIAVANLKEVLSRIPARWEEADSLAVRQANAAVGLLRLSEAEPVWPLLKHKPDPSLRSHLLARLQPLGVDPIALVKRMEAEADVSARRALILALGEFGEDRLPETVRGPLREKLLLWYRDDPDPGIHGAIDWLLRHGKEGPVDRALDWGQRAALEKIDAELAGKPDAPARERFWYVNSQGQTLVEVRGPVEFWMGSPANEMNRMDNELRHRRRIDRSFAMATKPVTVREWEAFRKAHPEISHSYTKQYSPEPDGPIITITWYDAAQYCRWLSEVERVPEEQMVYPPVTEIEKAKRDPVSTPLKLPADHLSRTGYRLPTEAEWEYACRVGAETSRYYGNTVELLPRYAWYLNNSNDRTWPVGQKRPNDLGLFDLHGNVWQWCQEGYRTCQPDPESKSIEDNEDIREITDRLSRVLRGGSVLNRPSSVRCPVRNDVRPPIRNNAYGLRLARTRIR